MLLLVKISMLVEGLSLLQELLDVVVVPTNYSFKPSLGEFEAQAQIALNYDLGIRSTIKYDSNKDAINYMYVSENPSFYNLKWPTAINSYLCLVNCNVVENSVSYGINKVEELCVVVPSQNFNLELDYVNIVDYGNNSRVFYSKKKIDKSRTTKDKIFFEDNSLSNIDSQYVKIIDCSGFIIDFSNHEVLERKIYANAEFTPILEYIDTF